MAGAVTKPAALLRYGAWALVPLLLFTGLFLGAIGAEELSGAAIIPELLGRAALPFAALLLGVAGLGWAQLLTSVHWSGGCRAPRRKIRCGTLPA